MQYRRAGFFALVSAGILITPLSSSVQVAAGSIMPQVTNSAGTASSCAGGNPYSNSAAIDEACGLTVSPLTSTSNLADGGTSYNYMVGDLSVHQIVPPANFNPSTASAAELSLYAPPMPSGATAQARAAWQAVVPKLHAVTPVPFLVSDPKLTYGPGNSTNWAGYSDTSPSNTAYTSSDATFNQPIIGASTCLQNSEATWGGLGGAAGGDDGLAQDGTSIGQGSGNSYGENQAW